MRRCPAWTAPAARSSTARFKLPSQAADNPTSRMFTIVGLVVVFGCVLGGFLMVGGPVQVLLQPAELVVIGGAALGTLLAGAPGQMRARLFATLATAFRANSPSKDDYLELLKLQYEVFSFMRKNGAVALDEHVNDVEKSAIFKKYPAFLANHHAVAFFVDALRQIVNGTASADELDILLDAELETHHEQIAIPIGLLKTTGDSLPGLGICAAVLGIIVTMGHLDAGPEVIGHHVAAALVGTFLGILLCYGLVHPIANAAELTGIANSKYLKCIKEGTVASLRGAAPVVAIEFARKAIFADERPSADETDAACKAVKKEAGV
jgi:chemotaxis protein MotA